MERKRWPGESDEAYPELYTAIPPQPKEVKAGQLSKEQLRQYFEEGYVVMENFFTLDEVDPCREAVKKLVDDLALKLHAAGKIKKLYKDYGLFQRLTMIEKEFPGSNVILHKQGILPQEVRHLWANERLLNIIEQLIGPEIAGSPVWNIRTKTPNNEATVVPWHQDSAYFDNESYGVHVPTAWIPMLDANEGNGCLQMVKGGHRSGRVALHTCCAGNTWYIMLEEDEMARTLGVDLDNDIESCQVGYGGFVLFNNVIPHRSLPNISNNVRWSFDLRWQRPDKPFGLFGLKDGVLMRSSKIDNLKPDWEKFCSVDRTSAQSEYCEKEEDEFDTTISGPWMKKWEITHHNRHTAALDAKQKFVKP